MNFRQLDLNLLRVLAAIYRTGSVTEAGQQLALSQPATSNALARLRDFFGDELFVRSSAGLKPTRMAERVAPAVIAQLRILETVVAGGEDFDPAQSEMRWHLSLSDLGEMLFLPPLAAALRARAPRCRLVNVSVGAARVSAALEAREIDLAVGILEPRHRGIQSELLFTEHYVAISSSAGSPPDTLSRTLTPEQLAGAALVVASPTATFHGIVEQTLTRMKLVDRVMLRARHYGAIPELVASSDLIGIVPEMYARSLSERLDLRVWQLPEEQPSYEVHMLWHASTANEPAQAWLRALVRRLFSRTPPQEAATLNGSDQTA